MCTGWLLYRSGGGYTGRYKGENEKNVVDTSTACDMLQCSRQNLSYLVNERKIEPIIYGTKENLYLKGEIERVMNE